MPQRSSWRLARGDLLARSGQWQEALSDYAVGCLSPHDETIRWRYIVLQLAAGLRNSYEASCQEFFDEFEASDTPWRPTEVARVPVELQLAARSITGVRIRRQLY